MRICLVSRYFDFKNAGLGRVGIEIETELVRRGHSVLKVYTKGTSLYSYFFYTLVEIPFRLPKADAYHAISPMEGLWLPKKKSVVTFHDIFQITDKEKLGSGLGGNGWKNSVGTRYFEWVCKTSKRLGKLVAVSEKTKEEVIEYLGVPRSRIRVIRSGVSPALHPWPKTNQIFRVGYLGQLDRRKRVDLLIKAFKESKLDELVLGGTGVDRPSLEALAEEDKRIKFLGRVPESKLIDFYNSLDVFVFPTWLEGYGLPIVEAMACKKPVIVLADAKIPWEVMSRCIIVDSLDYVLGNQKHLENRCKVVDIEGNYLWAKEHSWEKCVDEYEKLYEEVLHG